MSKRTFVLIPGGGHGGWCYQRVTPLLREAGHDVYAPSLTGLADRAHLLTPDTDLDTHVTDVVNLLTYEDLRDVILVGHSYGGMVITGAADRAIDRVGHVVYLDSATPGNGESLATHSKPFVDAQRPRIFTVDGVELIMRPSAALARFLGVTDPDDVAWVVERLTPHPWKTTTQPLHLTNEAALWALPQTHICCTASLPIRDVERIKEVADGRLWDIDTGHDLMITEPSKTADLLLKVAAL